MDQNKDVLERHWIIALLAIWLAIAAAMVVYRWPQIQWFVLGDTDDNMRLMQVRAWLAGQDWYDLRQYRLAPPVGADIHWSRFVDLPIAGIILAAKPFVGQLMAERIAVAIAPMLPLGVALLGLATTVRRLVAPGAWLIAVGVFISHVSLLLMFLPQRIDHHGWQLALLAVMLAGMADHRPARGGFTVGLATAASLVIGMEMLPYLAIAGAAVALRWALGGEALRMRAYAVSLSGFVALGFLGFASNANWAPRCDALTPVWVSTLLLAAAMLFLLSLVKAQGRVARMALGLGAGVVVAAFFVLAWPACLGRPEQVSPELERLWLANISEARPLYVQNWATILSVSALSIGMIANIWAWRKERRPVAHRSWAMIVILSVLSAALLFWQARAAPSALLFSIPGATALGWAVLPRLRQHSSVLVRTFGVVAAFMLISGLAMQLVIGQLPDETKRSSPKAVQRANARCPSTPALAPLGRIPPATIMTFVDLGPRLITVTHHNAIAGPYHRNGEAILDLQHAWRGTPDTAHAVARKYGATLLLLCPYLSESTIYKVGNPKGFYAQLEAGKVPDWLEPMPLPKDSPFKLWRIK